MGAFDYVDFSTQIAAPFARQRPALLIIGLLTHFYIHSIHFDFEWDLFAFCLYFCFFIRKILKKLSTFAVVIFCFSKNDYSNK
jgi:hypothetical protein